MQLTGIVTQVQERKATSKMGLPVVYRDIFFGDANVDPLTRFPAEVVLRPTDEENTEHKFKEGQKFLLSIRQVLEVRNGLPVVRARVTAAK